MPIANIAATPMPQQASQMGLQSIAGGSPSSSPQTPQQSSHFTGVVEVNGDKVEVKNGVLNYDGDTVFVSDDGKLVVDQKKRVLGSITNGVFKVTDKVHQKELLSSGVLERSK